MKLSVIVPTYNSAATLPRLLESLDGQTLTEREVIVVDDASTDETARIAARHRVVYERLEANQGPAASRNRGAALARGEWLVFTDADTVFSPDTLQAIHRVIEGSDAAALFGTYSGEPANPGFLPRYKALWEYYTIDMTFFRAGQRDLYPSTTWVPRPGAVSRAAFEAVGGFDTRFRGADLEDLELGYRLHEAGYRIYFAPGIRIKHMYPETLCRGLGIVARRGALWMRMAARRRKMDPAGDGSPRVALAHACGFAVFWLAVASPLWPPLALAALAGFLCHAFLHRDFLALALRQEGPGFMARSLAACWLYSLAGEFGAVYGLLTTFSRRA